MVGWALFLDFIANRRLAIQLVCLAVISVALYFRMPYGNMAYLFPIFLIFCFYLFSKFINKLSRRASIVDTVANISITAIVLIMLFVDSPMSTTMKIVLNVLTLTGMVAICVQIWFNVTDWRK